MRIALAQINSTVGDLTGNAEKIASFAKRAEVYAAEVVVFPELAITGYPPEDLLLKPRFIADNIEFLQRIKKRIGNIIAIIGFVDKVKKDIFNSAAVIYQGKILGIYHKIHLPNYGVFDEKRYFKAGKGFSQYRVGGDRFGVLICEDVWEKEPVHILNQAGTQIIFNLNASPYHLGKLHAREEILKKRAKENKVCIGYVNLVGGQDELIFDGRSMIVDQKGKILCQAKAFEEDLLLCDLNPSPKICRKRVKGIVIARRATESPPQVKAVKAKTLSQEEEVYSALKLGLGDYVRKNHFKKVVIGLSGGIDSALTAAIAVDALGKENVAGIFMPSQFSSQESLEDSSRLAKNLGIEFKIISIEELFESYKKVLAPVFNNLPVDVAEENIQARIRGNLLMATSNKFGWLVLTTGNKSEYSCGYATLYGDMAGGFAVIKDVPKTLIFALAKYRNRISEKEVIPHRIITKEPTAELRPNQKDTDSLPPYNVLDRIITAYVEKHQSGEVITKKLSIPDTVTKVIRLIDRSEYKRRQAPPGIKITPLAFGKDWRMPITNGYKG